MKLFLENVRSFEGWHEIPIAPATVLLGENSAGKSTLLGMLSVVHNEGFPFGANTFNQFPFELGSFKTIANSKRGVVNFSVGFQTRTSSRIFRNSKTNDRVVDAGLIASFSDSGGLPVLCHAFAWMDDQAITFTQQEFQHIDRNKQLHFEKKMRTQIIIQNESTFQGLNRGYLFNMAYKLLEKKSESIKDENVDYLIHYLFGGGLQRADALAFAPMRSRPRRTYDQLSDAFSPEGDHVPLLLARATDPSNKQSAALHEAIQSFGRYSEMFSDISVKQLGRGSGDPFQVQVKNGTKQTNLMDVGYGVSQVLPLIVDAQRSSANTTLLLQQPEVHLHPKAQAALGSMVKDWVSKNNKTVVVETHSDYLVDRLRLEVKRKNLKSSDLKIFFLEKKNGKTELHVLEVDAQGNVLNAPDGYRDFFLREQMALLVD